MKIIGWPYNITLKSLTGYTSLWLTDFPYYDHRKKRQTNGITIGSFFVWQFMVHGMSCMPGQTGKTSKQHQISFGLEYHSAQKMSNQGNRS